MFPIEMWGIVTRFKSGFSAKKSQVPSACEPNHSKRHTKAQTVPFIVGFCPLRVYQVV